MSIYDIIPPEIIEQIVGYMTIPTRVAMRRTSRCARNWDLNVSLAQVPLRLAIYSCSCVGTYGQISRDIYPVLYVGWFTDDVEVHNPGPIDPMTIAVYSLPHNIPSYDEDSIGSLDITTLYSTSPVMLTQIDGSHSTTSVRATPAAIISSHPTASMLAVYHQWRYELELDETYPRNLIIKIPAVDNIYVIHKPSPDSRRPLAMNVDCVKVVLGSLDRSVDDKLFSRLRDCIIKPQFPEVEGCPIAVYSISNPISHDALSIPPCSMWQELAGRLPQHY